jgi:hypothetical protein
MQVERRAFHEANHGGRPACYLPMSRTITRHTTRHNYSPPSLGLSAAMLSVLSEFLSTVHVRCIVVVPSKLMLEFSVLSLFELSPLLLLLRRRVQVSSVKPSDNTLRPCSVVDSSQPGNHGSASMVQPWCPNMELVTQLQWSQVVDKLGSQCVVGGKLIILSTISLNRISRSVSR